MITFSSLSPLALYGQSITADSNAAHSLWCQPLDFAYASPYAMKRPSTRRGPGDPCRRYPYAVQIASGAIAIATRHSTTCYVMAPGAAALRVCGRVVSIYTFR